ncbi:MAG: DUF934 domain-containing protein [Pseudomonadota bacterium]
MSVIVTDSGFAEDDWTGELAPLETLEADARAVDVPSDADAAVLSERLKDLEMIRIDFPKFADGRGFTIAQRLRAMGYKGRLRAAGHVLADQYTMARRVGFDEVEISDELAQRQPEAQWLFSADWKAHDYQAKLRG